MGFVTGKIEPAPIIATGKTDQLLSATFLDALLSSRTTKQLAEDLRARSIAIPKTKNEMIDRLVSWLGRDEGNFTVTLH